MEEQIAPTPPQERPEVVAPPEQKVEMKPVPEPRVIDWLNRQGSLNGGQARLDADGRFRAVIAHDDPGVPNWLDPGGWSEGAIMLRWTEASSGPEPTLRAVPLTALRDHLPADTPTVDADARQESLRARRRGVQLRRRW